MKVAQAHRLPDASVSVASMWPILPPLMERARTSLTGYAAIR
jgi:hypothetical protein